jgi:hypothetical protein
MVRLDAKDDSKRVHTIVNAARTSACATIWSVLGLTNPRQMENRPHSRRCQIRIEQHARLVRQHE